MQSISQNPLLESALAYARAGFRVFPCRPGQKEPVQGIKWVQEATNHLPQIETWWGTRRPITPGANIGVVADHRLFLDIDRKPGKPNGCETLRDFLPLPVTPTVATPNNGWHAYFKVPDGWQPKRKSGPGFDIQIGNAYVLAPPSWLGPRWLGKEPYRWCEDYLIDAKPLAMIPEPLMGFLEQAPERSKVVTGDRPPLLSREEVAAIRPDVSGWPDQLREWWEHGRVEGYDTKSEVVHALAWQLYQMSLTPQQVLSVLWEHGYTQRVALEHRRGDTEAALAWLWLSCAKLEESRRPSAEEVFDPTGDETADALYERLLGVIAEVKAKNIFGTAEEYRRVSEVLSEGLRLPETARALLAGVIGSSGFHMTRKQAEEVLFPKRSKSKPKGSGQTIKELSELKEHIWVGPMDKFYNIRTGAFLTKHAAVNQYAHLASEQQSKEEVVEELLRQESTKVEGLTFRPDLDPGRLVEGKRLVWNMAQGILLEPVKGDWSPYMNLFEVMKISPADRDHILDYFAWIIQQPGRRIRHALIIGGEEQGTGKDTLVAPMGEVLGRGVDAVGGVYEMDGTRIGSNFNGQVMNRRLVVAQELYKDPRRARAQAEVLKPLVTNDYIEIEGKHKDAINIRNFVHLVITTNSPHPLHIGDRDRRYGMVRVGLEFKDADERQAMQPVWDRFYFWLRELNGAAVILHHLLERDLNHFNPNAAPERTTWHADVVEGSYGQMETIMREVFDDDSLLMRLDCFTLEHATIAAKAEHPEALNNGRPITWWDVQEALKALGYVKRKKSYDHPEKNQRVKLRLWVKPEVWEEKLEPMTGDALKAWYDEHIRSLPRLQTPGNLAFLPQEKGLTRS